MGHHRRRLYLTAAVTVLAVAVLATLVAHSPPARRTALRWLQSHARDFGIDASGSRLSYNLLTLEFQLQDLSLASSQGGDGAFFEADQIDIDLPWSFLRGDLSLQALSVTGARVRLVRDERGIWNLPISGAAEPGVAEAGASVPIRLGRLSLQGIDLLLEDRAIGLGGRLSDLDVTLEPDGDDSSGTVSLRGQGALFWRGEELPVTGLEAAVDYRGDSLHIDRLRIESPAFSSGASIRLSELWSDPQLATDLELGIDLQTATQTFSAAPRLTGTMNLTAVIEGSLVDPRARVSLAAQNVEGWGGELQQLSASATVSTAAAEITALEADLLGGHVTATGRLELEDPQKAGALRLHWQDIDPSPLFMALAGDTPVAVELLVDGAGEAVWTELSPAALNLNLSASTRQPPAGSRGLTAQGSLELDVEGGEWSLDANQRLPDLGQIRARVAGRFVGAGFADGTVDGEARVELPDLAAAVRRLAGAGLLPELRESSLPAGALSVDLRVAGEFARPVVEAVLSSSSLRLSGVEVTGLHGEIDIDRESARARSLRARVGSSQVSFAGELRFADGTVSGKTEALLPDLDELTAAMPEPWRATGSMSAQGSVAGTLAEPRFEARVSGENLEVAGQDLGSLVVNVGVSGRDVSLEGLRLEQGGGGRGRLELDASYAHSTGEYDLRATASEFEIVPVPGHLADAAAFPLRARLGLDMNGSGTLAAPEGHALVRLDHAAYDEMRLGSLEADLTLTAGDLLFKVSAPELGSELDGRLAAWPLGSFAARLAITDLDLGRWSPHALAQNDLALRGTTTGSMRLEGDARDLAATSAVLRLDRLEGFVADTPFHLERAGEVALEQGVLHSDDIGLAVGGSEVRLAGRLQPEGAGELSASLEGDLSDFEDLLDLLLPGVPTAAADAGAEGSEERLVLTGGVRLEVRVSGTLDRPVIDSALDISEGSVAIAGLPPVGGLGIALEYRDGVLSLEQLSATWQGAGLTASGRLPARLMEEYLPAGFVDSLPATQQIASLNLRVDSISPALLAPFVDDTLLQQISIDAALDLSLEADALSLDRVRGEVVVERSDLVLAGLSVRQQVPTRLELVDGRLTVTAWDWIGPRSSMAVRGGVDLSSEPTIDLTVEGDLDLQLLRLLVPDVTASGRSNLSVHMHGPALQPLVEGEIRVHGGEVRLASPRLLMRQVEGSVLLGGGRIRVAELTGVANGGGFTLTGELDHVGAEITGGELKLTGTGIALADPVGMRSAVDLELALRFLPQFPILSGRIVILRAAYREPMSVTLGLLAAIRERARAAVTVAAPTFLDLMQFDIRVLTDEDFLVDNNLARLALSADLTLTGTLAAPALGGRAALEEGGRVFLGGNAYRLESGSIDFISPTRIEPVLDLTAHTKISAYEVTLRASGAMDDLRVDLESNPPLDQSDLVSLLVTGRTLGQAGSMQTEVATRQMLGLITGEVASRAGRAVGLDSVRLEQGSAEEDLRFNPLLIATETEPDSRVTLSKRIPPNLELIFSQSLSKSGGFSWIVSYRVLRNISLRMLSGDDNNRAYEFSHEIRFGGGAGSRASGLETAEPRIARITFGGRTVLDQSTLADELKLSTGDRFDFFRWQDDRERLERLYRRRGFWEVQIQADRQLTGGPPSTVTVELSYDIDAGPRTIVQVDGFELNKGLANRLEEVWVRSVVDEFLLEELVAETRKSIMLEGYLAPQVSAEVVANPSLDTKTAIVSVDPGSRTRRRVLELRGQRLIGEPELSRFVAGAGLGDRAWNDPLALITALSSYYRDRGMLDAVVTIGEPELRPGEALLPVQIDEGPLYRLGSVEVVGAQSRGADQATATLGLSAGEPFVASRLEEGRSHLDAAYRGDGFNQIDIRILEVADAESELVAVTFEVTEGAQQILSEIAIDGGENTRRSVVENALDLQPGVPLDLRAVYRARKRLYDTGVFQRVEMVTEPVDVESEPPIAAAGPGPQSATELIRLRVRLEERQRFQFRYGLRVHDEAPITNTASRQFGAGFSTDLTDRNLLGRAITTGASVRYQLDYQAVRGFIGTPTFFGLPLTTSGYVLRSREDFGEEGFFPFITDITGVSVEQRFRLAETFGVAYSYTFERNHTFEKDPDPDFPFPFDLTLNVARVGLAALADQRDDIFDAHEGWFHSSSLEHAIPSLGSDVRFTRYLAQQYFYWPLPRRIVLASALRLGLASAYGEELIPSERFYAGGGNSVRGYPENSLGPTNFFGDPIGGEALFIFKQEVRFPVYWIVRGVGFFDAGNAFATPADLSFTDLKTSAGLGLRINTPLVLLRFDYGFRFGREPGDPIGAFFFSIGQAF